MSALGMELLLVVVMVVVVIVHGITIMVRPRQIEAAVTAALAPLVRDLDAMRKRLDGHEERMSRAEAHVQAIDSETSKRLHEVLVHVTRIESGMQTRADYERLHARINELGREMREAMNDIAGEIASTQANAEQAIARVTRVEQHLMEQNR
jgi:chromosome segregation ATPase